MLWFFFWGGDLCFIYFSECVARVFVLFEVLGMRLCLRKVITIFVIVLEWS